MLRRGRKDSGGKGNRVISWLWSQCKGSGLLQIPSGPMFEHNDLKANPDGVYYKVFGKLSAGDITSAEAAEDLMKGIDDCYNF